MAQGFDSAVTRRHLLRVLGLSGAAALAAACSQPAAPAPTAAPAKPTEAPKPAAPTSAAGAAPAQPTTAPAAAGAAKPAVQAPAQSSGAGTGLVDELVANAKKDGTVSIATYSGTGYRKIMDDFEKAFPGVKVDHTSFQSSSRDFVPRLLQERKAGVFAWDLAIMPSPEMIIQVKPVGGLASVKSLLVLPEILDDKTWQDGFNGGWLDNGKELSYGFMRVRSQSLWFDTNQVKEGEVKSWKDLLDPKWRGKILAGDPRTKGSAFNLATSLRLKTKDDTSIRQLFKDQEAVLSTDARQLTEFAVRGRYPVSVGAVSKPILLDFMEQGVGKNLKNLPSVELDYVYSGSSILHHIDKAPHPAAAKLFANWLLTKEGSTSWSKNIADNSRRADIPPADPDTVPEKGMDYILIDQEEIFHEIEKAQELAKSYLN